MNYKKIYDQLLEKAKVRGLNKSKHEGYFEIHHIIPRCMGGSDNKENLVMFTAKEHYIAHLLLWKAYPEEEGLFYAAYFMSNHLLLKQKSRIFEKLRVENSKKLSERNSNNSGFKSNNFKDLVGEVRGRLTVISFAGWTLQDKGTRTSLWACDCSCGNSTVLAAKFLSKKSGTRSCGCARTEKSKARTGAANPSYGKSPSAEVRKKMSEIKMGISVNKGAIRTEENRKKISEGLKARNRPAWEAGTVVTKPAQLQKWLMADYYYDLYLTNTELTSAKFTTLYNRLHNDSLAYNTFDSMHKEFVKGWIPLEDPKWIEFSKGF